MITDVCRPTRYVWVKGPIQNFLSSIDSDYFSSNLKTTSCTVILWGKCSHQCTRSQSACVCHRQAQPDNIMLRNPVTTNPSPNL